MMAKTYSIMNRNEEASVYFSKAINLANENKLSEDLKRLYNEAFSFYLEIGDVKNAKENFQKWEYLSDSLNSIAQMDNIIKYKTLYETEKKEKENKDLKNSIQIKARNNIIFISTGGILLVLLIFILYVYLQRTKYLKLLISRAQLKIEQYDNEAKTKAYAKVDNTKENEIAKAIHRILIDEKLYMNTQLTLEMLADEAKTNRKTLSQTINSSFGMNFNSLINFYRVEAAKKLLVDPLHKNHKMEAIGFIAGFNTRQNFYLAFNKYVGMSPAEYQQKNS
jgi:AraC-like DNA-binding protein